MLIGLAAGAAAGIGSFTFVYAQGASYLTDDPAACANCHVMRDHYAAWSRSSHHAVAVCNDCHAPAGFFSKYGTKALNGFNHSLAFTTGNFHEPLKANAMNRRIAREACAKCHADVVARIDHAGVESSDCVRCHAHVGHLR